MERSRRRFVASMGGFGSVAFAGCLGSVGEAAPGLGDDAAGEQDTDDADDDRAAVEVLEGDPDGDIGTHPAGDPEDDPPVAETRYHLAWEPDHLESEAVSGGVGQDGIPSIDDPTFLDAGEAPYDDGDPVFGVERNGVVRAYPQEIMVWHEIVNDEFDGEPVSVTYCPLTGTAQGFERGFSEFGVSGQLVNSNLIMYDRTRANWWPQVLATAVDGPATGHSLREFRVYWTTWGEWVEAHPDTAVLGEDTSRLRQYGNDPYGEYNPPGGYYERSGLLFDPLTRDDEIEDTKTVVLGARTEDAAIAFRKALLLDRRVLEGPLGDESAVAVADSTLSTGYIYRNPEESTIEPVDDGYLVDGDTYAPDALPLDRVLTMDAMWFAWYGFYPTTTYVH